VEKISPSPSLKKRGVSWVGLFKKEGGELGCPLLKRAERVWLHSFIKMGERLVRKIMPLSVIVLTRNEEANIRECLKAVSWADEILVVDSGSLDRTREIARELGVRVLEHPMKDFADQRNYAMDQAKGDWVLFVDADERVTPELADEIKRVIGKARHFEPRKDEEGRTISSFCPSRGSQNNFVYAIPRHTYFLGRRLRFGDSRNDAPIRLFPRSHVRWTQPVHEVIRTNLPCRRLENSLRHYSTRDLAHYMQKVRDYIPLEHATMREKGTRTGMLKLILMPPAKFFQLFFWKFGILDGLGGFQYAALSAYYTFMKYRKSNRMTSGGRG